MRLERALNSKTRVAGEQLELQQGDLVDFWRKPATKDESGWRGPARVLEPPGSSGDSTQSAATIKWQGRSLSVRTQDLRRALVYIALFLFPTWGSEMQGKECPVRILTAFADELEPGKLVRVGWIQGSEKSSRAWLRAKSAARYSEVLLATLHAAAAHFGLCGCIGSQTTLATRRSKPL